MSAQQTRRLEALADLIEANDAQPHRTGQSLWYQDPHGNPSRGGISILGLICQAHEVATQDGGWMDLGESTLYYMVKSTREKETHYLPGAVVSFFGLRDREGSFDMQEISPGLKRQMRGPVRAGTFSLRGIGIQYAGSARHIAAEVIREMPPSLITFVPSRRRDL